GLAVALFIAIPAAGAALIAWLVERIDQFWWKRRWPTAVAALAAVPSIVFLPIAILAVAGGTVWLAAGRAKLLRRLAEGSPGRLAASLVFATVVAVGGFALVLDVRDVL